MSQIRKRLKAEYRALANPRQLKRFMDGNGSLANRGEIAELYQYDWHARKLKFETHFRGLILLQATAYRSTRDYQWAAENDPLYLACGAGVEISVAGLAQANRDRPLGPMLELAQQVLTEVGNLPHRRLRALDKETWQGIVRLLQQTDLIDALTVELPPRLEKWAKGKKEGTSALKLQLRMDGWDGSFKKIMLTPEPGVDTPYLPHLLSDLSQLQDQIFVFDGGYWKIDYYHEIADSQNYFVTKLNKRIKPLLVKKLPLPQQPLTSGYTILSDDLIYLGDRQDITYRRLEVIQTQGKQITLLTNLIHLSADQICLLYRYRWTIEIVFRWLQQTLDLDHMMSHSPTGIVRQILLTLILWGLLVIFNQNPSKLSPKLLWRQLYADLHQSLLEFGFRLGVRSALASSPENFSIVKKIT